MKTYRFNLWLFSLLFSALLGVEASLQSAQPGTAAAGHSDGPREPAGLRSPILKELLSGTLEFHHIIQREEAALLQARLRMQPNDTDLLLKTAKALKLASQFGQIDEQAWLEARTLLLKCVGHDPNNTTAWFTLGNWYLNELMFKEARDCFEKAKKLGAAQKDVEYAFQGLDDWETRVKNGTMRAIPMRKLRKPNERPLHELRPIDEQGLSAQTKSLLDRVNTNRKDAKNWHELAKSLAHGESLPSASMKAATYRCLINARQHDPSNIEVREMLAEIYRNNGTLELMKEESRHILERDPNNMKAKHLLEPYGGR